MFTRCRLGLIDFLALVLVKRFRVSECDGQDAGATATADQALIRASKAHTGIRREIPFLRRVNTAIAALQPSSGNSLTGSGTLAIASSSAEALLLSVPVLLR
jgi:hypothetical protein